MKHEAIVPGWRCDPWCTCGWRRRRIPGSDGLYVELWEHLRDMEQQAAPERSAP